MPETDSYQEKPGCLRWILPAGILAFVVYALRAELVLLWGVARNGYALLLGAPISIPLEPVVAMVGMIVLLVTCFLLGVYLVSQVIFSTSDRQDRGTSFWRILSAFPSGKEKVYLVRKGTLAQAKKKDSQVADKRPGVMLVDTSSAVVLDDARKVHGAGFVFRRTGEKLQGTVDLRKQVRRLQNVRAYTFDGVEVETTISVVFTLGRPPDVLPVTVTDDHPQQVRVIRLAPDGRTIEGLDDILTLEDKEEIFHFMQQVWPPQGGSEALQLDSKQLDRPPYILSPDRIAMAVFSKAQNIVDGTRVSWTDLPSRVAGEFFRNMIAGVTYEELYLPRDLDRFPLADVYRPEFDLRLRHQGLLSYQLVQRRDGCQLIKGQLLDRKLTWTSPVEPFRRPTILRKQGIKLLSASFSDLVPLDPYLQKRGLNQWNARRQQRTEGLQEEAQQEFLNVRSKARREAEREMVMKISDALRSSASAPDTQMLNLLHVLEVASGDPATRQLLPMETLSRLNQLRYWLVSDRDAWASSQEATHPPHHFPGTKSEGKDGGNR